MDPNDAGGPGGRKNKWRIDAAFLGSFPFLKIGDIKTNEHGN